MRRHSFAALVTAVGLLLGGPTAAYAYEGGKLPNHAHSSVAGQGGSTLTPATITVTSETAQSLTASSYFHCSSCVFLIDGSATVTLPAGVALNAPSITGVGPSALGQAFTITGSQNNAWNVVAVSSFVGVQSATYTLLGASVTYRGHCDLLLSGTNSEVRATFNAEQGTVYSYDEYGASSAGLLNASLDGQGSILLTANAGSTTGGTGVGLVFPKFGTQYGSAKKTSLFWESQSLDNGGSRANGANGSGVANLTAALSSFQIMTTAGTMSGYCMFEQFVSSLTR